MGIINSIVYVQREIKNIFRYIYNGAFAYVDNIIYGAKSIDNLISKLCIFFVIFIIYKISIKPLNIFFNYPNMGIFCQ